MSALLRIEELERRLAKDSHNSSKPPSSDGLKRKVLRWLLWLRSLKVHLFPSRGNRESEL